jgi:hypothetical protein
MNYETTATFVALLKDFGVAIGIDGLALNEASACTLAVGELMLNLQWLPQAEKLLVYAPVGAPDVSVDALRFCEALLEANCMGRETDGFTLGLFREVDSIVLSGQVPLQNLDAQSLYDFVERFAEQGKNWQQRLAAGVLAPKEADGGFDAAHALRV